MTDYMTFDDLFTQVSRAIKDFQESQANLVKMVINQVYLTEVLHVDDLYPLFWLVDFDDSIESQAPSTITGISVAANAIVTTSAVHGLAIGDLVTIHAVVGMTEINDQIYQVVAVPDTTHVTLSCSSASFTAYASGGTMHHRGTTLQTSGKNVQRLLLAEWHDEAKMEQILPEEMSEWTGRFHYTDDTERPERWYFGKSYTTTGTEVNQIIWHPGADASYRLRYWFETRPTRLVNDADVPLLPPMFHDAIVAGAIVRLAENNVQVENGLVWPGIYKAHIGALVEFNRKYYLDNNRIDRQHPFMV